MSAAAPALDKGERFDQMRRRVGLWLGPVAFVALLVAPTGLPAPAHRLAAVLGLVMVYWISEALPLPVTALVGPTLAVLLGVAPVREGFAPFADPVIFLFIGSFLLAEALAVHGLDRRLALALLSRPAVARSPALLRCTVGLATAAVSMWMSNTATAAMMLPIVLGLSRALRSAGGGEAPRGLLLVMGMGASLGGIATPVGTPPNLIALGILERVGGQSVDFLSFMCLGLPLSLALLGVTLVALRRLAPPGAGVDVSAPVAEERRALPPWGPGQTACAAAFGLAVVLWIGPSVLTLLGWGGPHAFEESLAAIVAATLLFAWPVGERAALTWKEGARIDWGTLLLFGGGLALGKMMFDSGLAEQLGRWAVAATGVRSLWGLTALALASTIVLTEVTSNTATVNMLAPLVVALSRDLGVAVVPPVLAVAFGASMGFMFPVGTPPNAIVYGTGLVPLTTMMRVGIVVDVMSFFVILAGLRLLCPLLGLA